MPIIRTQLTYFFPVVISFPDTKNAPKSRKIGGHLFSATVYKLKKQPAFEDNRKSKNKKGTYQKFSQLIRIFCCQMGYICSPKVYVKYFPPCCFCVKIKVLEFSRKWKIDVTSIGSTKSSNFTT